MSKQLAISAAFSTFAMAAFALFATAGAVAGPRYGASGAPAAFAAPAYVSAPFTNR